MVGQRICLAHMDEKAVGLLPHQPNNKLCHTHPCVPTTERSFWTTSISSELGNVAL